MTSPDWYQETLARQLSMTPQTWAALTAHGITDDSPLRLDFSFDVPAEASADELVAFLRLETSHDVDVDFSRDPSGGERRWSVIGATHPTTVSAEILDDWIRWMVTAGAEYGGCVFQGWSAQVGRE